MSVVWSLTGTTVTDTTLYMFHTVNGCIMRVYWFYSLLSFSVVHRVKVPIVSSFTIKYYNFYVFKENLLEQNVF